jgi:hypothetical protein
MGGGGSVRGITPVSPPGLPVAGVSFHAGNLDFAGCFAMSMLLREGRHERSAMASHICAVVLEPKTPYPFRSRVEIQPVIIF